MNSISKLASFRASFLAFRAGNSFGGVGYDMFMKLGLPYIVVSFIITMIALPILFPF